MKTLVVRINVPSNVSDDLLTQAGDVFKEMEQPTPADEFEVLSVEYKIENEDWNSAKNVSATEAIEFLCNKLRPITDRRILVAKGVDGDDEMYTELCDEDDIPNIEDGTYYDFQIWS